MTKVEDKVLELARRVAAGREVTVEEVRISGRGRRTLLRVTIDKEGGVTVTDCERYSRDLEALMDVEDPIAGPYTLEVSSPGLDRPLRSMDEFRRFKGRLARVVLRENVAGGNVIVGRIVSAEGDIITLDRDGEHIEVVFDNITRARLEIEW